MNKAKYLFLLIATLAFASCRPTARQTVTDAEQPTDSTEAVTSADTLRLVITDKSLSQTDSVIRRTLKLPLDSIVVEMMNNTDSTCTTGEAYAIEQRTNSEWKALPIKTREDGADRNTASSRSFSNPNSLIPKASIAILQLNDVSNKWKSWLQQR